MGLLERIVPRQRWGVGSVSPPPVPLKSIALAGSWLGRASPWTFTPHLNGIRSFAPAVDGAHGAGEGERG